MKGLHNVRYYHLAWKLVSICTALNMLCRPDPKDPVASPCPHCTALIVLHCPDPKVGDSVARGSAAV